MNTLSIKKNTLKNFFALLGSITYGFFVVASLHRLFLLDSGDVNDLVDFFDEMKGADILAIYSIAGDGIFRFAVVSLAALLGAEVIDLLGYIAFTTSLICFWICAVNIKSSNHLIHILPLFLMIFLSQNVVNLFASGVRSGIAFTILMIAINHRNVIIKCFLFGLSSMFHLSMLPIIFVYILFYILRDRRINASLLSSYFLLILYSFSIAILAYITKFNVTDVNSSFILNFLIFCIALLMIFTTKKVIGNVFGFMSIGIILIVIAGNMIDLSFSRYIGNALLLYLLFLTQESNLNNLKVFSLGFAPYFAITTFYSLLNLL
jgi:hypothetical protein